MGITQNLLGPVKTSQDWMIPCYGDQDFDADSDYDVDIIRPRAHFTVISKNG